MTDPTTPEIPDPEQANLPRSVRKAIARNQPSWSDRHAKLLYWAPTIFGCGAWLILGLAALIASQDSKYAFLACIFSVTTAGYGLQRYNEFKRGWNRGYTEGQLDVIDAFMRKRIGKEGVPSTAMTRKLATGDPAPQPWEHDAHMRAPHEQRG